MANYFEQFGIKEVADVQFEALEDSADELIKKGDVVLFLDTLKTSTTETTASSAEARGGKGNPSLIIWDFGREITVNLQDALMSFASQQLMNGAKINSGDATVRVNEKVVMGEDTVTLKAEPKTGTKVRYINQTTGKSGTSTGTFSDKVFTPGSGEMVEGDDVYLFYDVQITGKSVTMTIDAKTFPGTYKVYGDTLIRNQNGKDFPYQFIIERAKVLGETTLTLEAEGDPSVFDMSLRVLRDNEGNMIKFVRYELE